MTPEQRALKERFKLEDWIAKDFRRSRYFSSVDEARDSLRKIIGGEEPTDNALVKMVAIMVSEDDSFTDHVLRRNDLAYDWTELHLATAGMICERHLRDSAEGRWGHV